MTTIIKKITFFCVFIMWHMFLATINLLQAQNTNPPVGAISGAIDVSPVGATTYTIPIEVVPGTQGIQPNLSIQYNSFGGMGLLGMKWNIAGLSAITRCGQTPYFDLGNRTSIQFGANDKYSLDGDRLINIGNSSQPQFATEIENFTLIFQYNSYDHFKAYTDDGRIIEYGNTPNSKQTMENTNNILSWQINRVIDANGNCMDFNYWNNNGEILINSISYGGNASNSMQPYASIEFDYGVKDIPDTLGKNTCFVAGYGIPQTKLLRTITIKNNNTIVRKYQFKYAYENKTGERTTHLEEITLFGEGGNLQLTTTAITWGAQNNTKSEKELSTPDGNILTGDFNGDGYTDYIIYGQTNLKNKWVLYTNNPNTEIFNSSTTGNVLDGLTLFYKADVNGDGCDELITAELLDNNLKNYKFRILSIKNGISEIASKQINYFNQIFFGDFDGDGETDILFMKKDLNNNCTFEAYMSYYGGFITNLGLPNQPNLSCKVRVGDFNGDGKSDVELVFSNKVLYTCSYNGPYFSNLYSQQTVNYLSERYSGDFNGDGITDLLTYTTNGLSWQLYLGKGNGTYTSVTTNLGLNSQSEIEGDWILPQYKIMTADLDGDGKDEIIQVLGSSLTILYSKGCINGTYKFTPKTRSINASFSSPSHFNIADFNNDGILELIVQKERTFKPKVIYLHRNNPYESPREITDGFGKTLQFVFKPKYCMAKNGNMVKKYFYNILDHLQTSNGLGNNLNSFHYQYTGPAFSYLRRSFVGFEGFTCINLQENKKDFFQFSLDNSKFIMKPVSETTYYYDDIERYQTIYNFSFLDLGNLRHVPYSNETTVKNLISYTKTVTTTDLNLDGRIDKSNTKTYSQIEASNWLHSEIHTYFYGTINLNGGNQKKTDLTKIITTQQYGAAGIVIADTLSFSYFSATSPNKGRLAYERKGNIDGSITTSYDNYDIAGVYGTKTIAASGCTARTETYYYDATKRFINKIINPLNQITTFAYDSKTGNKLSETDPNGLTTSYTYDAFGKVKKITYPDNTQTTIITDWYSSSTLPNAKYSIVTKTSGKSDLTVYYDVLEREVRRKEDGYYYDTHYNEKGLTVKTSYPYAPLTTPEQNKIWREYTYDEYGRVLTETGPYTNLSYAYYFPFGNGIGVTDHLRNVSSVKAYDALGRIWMASDVGGGIVYNYEITNNKRYKTTIVVGNGGSKTTILTNLWGNRISITESNAGEITSQYNKFNELVHVIDSRHNATLYEYDKLGRVTKKEFCDINNQVQTIEYVYDLYDNSKGKLSIVKIDGLLSEVFNYDALSRLSNHTKTIDNKDYTHSYTYNANSQIQTLTYPDNFSIAYNYNSTTGKLNTIKRNSDNDNSLIYQIYSRNEFGATKSCEYGNALATAYTYNPYGLLTHIKTGNKVYGLIAEEAPNRGDEVSIGLGLENETYMLPFEVDGSILKYNYTYDTLGLMISRAENIANHRENYTYDNLDRLIKNYHLAGNGYQTQKFTYDYNGNILSNSLVGNYEYNSGRYNAVTKITPLNNNVISASKCNVTYNVFNQPAQIEEEVSTALNCRINLVYGADQQRNKTTIYENEHLKNTRYYISKYFEREVDTAHGTRHFHYIYGDNGVVALHIQRWLSETEATDTMYYIHTDHLGSYCAITNPQKQVRQRNVFDPWGNPVNNNFTLTARGFTGHEHYPDFKIINMNGRLYDPVIARFFSPDNFVQMPEFTQAYNRYTYCLNNPLKYVDPSGETWYDVDGNRRRIDDGFDNMVIDVSQRQFNRLERKFNRDKGYESFRDKMAYKNGFTEFSKFGEMAHNKIGVAPEFSLTWHEAYEKTYTFIDNTKGEQGLTPIYLEGVIATAYALGPSLVKMAGTAGVRAISTKAVDQAAHVVARDGMRSAAKTGTTVYRAVNSAEKASINSSKSFLLKEGGTEVKYFARTLQDAHWYGGKLYPEGYSVIKGSLNLSIDAGKYWYPYVDIGAYAFPGNILPYVKPIFP